MADTWRIGILEPFSSFPSQNVNSIRTGTPFVLHDVALQRQVITVDSLSSRAKKSRNINISWGSTHRTPSVWQICMPLTQRQALHHLITVANVKVFRIPKIITSVPRLELY